MTTLAKLGEILDESVCTDIETILERWQKNDVATQSEAALALMGACASVIVANNCEDRRKIAAEWAVKKFSEIMDDAMKFAAAHRRRSTSRTRSLNQRAARKGGAIHFSE